MYVGAGVSAGASGQFREAPGAGEDAEADRDTGSGSNSESNSGGEGSPYILKGRSEVILPSRLGYNDTAAVPNSSWNSGSGSGSSMRMPGPASAPALRIRAPTGLASGTVVFQDADITYMEDEV